MVCQGACGPPDPALGIVLKDVIRLKIWKYHIKALDNEI